MNKMNTMMAVAAFALTIGNTNFAHANEADDQAVIAYQEKLVKQSEQDRKDWQAHLDKHSEEVQKWLQNFQTSNPISAQAPEDKKR